MWDATKAVLIEKFLTLNANTRKEEKYEIKSSKISPWKTRRGRAI